MTPKHIVILCRHGPYDRASPREALDAALAATAFEQEVTVVFDGDGVRALLRDQHARAIGEKSVGANLEALPMFDVEDVRVTRRALEARALAEADLLLAPRVMSDEAFGDLLADSDQVLSY